MMKKLTVLLCLCMILTLPVSAMEPAPTETPTLPPLIVGIRTLEQIPENWADQEAILSLTSQPLYKLDGEGAVVPAQAAELPVDVTAEFAGSYGIPTDALRGYAYAIELGQGFWDDGKALTGEDWLYTIEKQLEQDVFPLEIANYRAFLRGDTGPVEQIVRLMDAGYNSVEEAENAGIRDFYVDTTLFWGLETGWRRSTDRTPLFDASMPSGCEEMYVTPAYLYRDYLGKTGSQTMFQREFVGIPAENGPVLTRADVGLFLREGRLILILQEQNTQSHVALALCGLYPVQQGAAVASWGTDSNYRSCGPYRIDSVTKQEILLSPNPYWVGEMAEFEQIRCVAAS